MATCVDVGGADYPATVGGRRSRRWRARAWCRRSPSKPLDARLPGVGARAEPGDPRRPVEARGEGRRPWELYDLDADPVELTDLAATMPERVKDCPRSGTPGRSGATCCRTARGRRLMYSALRDSAAARGAACMSSNARLYEPPLSAECLASPAVEHLVFPGAAGRSTVPVSDERPARRSKFVRR